MKSAQCCCNTLSFFKIKKAYNLLFQKGNFQFFSKIKRNQNFYLIWASLATIRGPENLWSLILNYCYHHFNQFLMVLFHTNYMYFSWEFLLQNKWYKTRFHESYYGTIPTKIDESDVSNRVLSVDQYLWYNLETFGVQIEIMHAWFLKYCRQCLTLNFGYLKEITHTYIDHKTLKA